MPKRASGALVRAIRAVAAATERTDLELLTGFNAGDEEAFAALVERYSGMVLGVCRRALPTVQDAEDACQATFLVLARKARSGQWQTSVANWLYTSARRIASRANRAAVRRAKREAQAAVPAVPSLLDQMTGREAFAALDEELDRLPAIYRDPLVLCYLAGLTRDEAAVRLGVPAATLKSQLDRGRKKLCDALTKRGIALGVGLLAAAATSTARAVSPVLHRCILAAAGGSPSAPVAALAKEVAVNEFLHRAKWAMLAVAGVAVLGFGFVSRPPAAEQPRPMPGVKANAHTPRVEVTQRTIAGRVLGADGKPAVAQLILLRSNGSPLPLGKTEADGRFRVTVPLGTSDVNLVARVEGQGAGYSLLSRHTGDVTLQLTKDNPVRGRVIDTQGKPVAGAVVFPRFVYDFGERKADLFLDYWKTKHPQSGALQGQNNLQFGVQTGFDLPGSGSVLAAKTNKDGRFEIVGLGAERIIGLRCRAPGQADAELLVVNRAKFDPSMVNKAAADNRERMLPRMYRNLAMETQLHGPEVAFVVEREKLIRGIVKDRDTGRPHPGVEVTLGRVSTMELLSLPHTATTDKNGKFELRGCRKHSAYIPEVAADPETGYLPAQVEVKDTAGYEPISVEIVCARGIVVTGRLTDTGTGKPLAGLIYAEPMQENPFLKKLPTMDRGMHGASQMSITRDDGSFRFVAVPGPVLVMAGLRVAQHEIMYKPPQADPKYPQYFHRRFGHLGYYATNGGLAHIRGCWCKVLDLKERENGFTLNIELEPAARKPVRVVGPDGKPLSGCDATGTAARNTYPMHQSSDTVSVYELVPKQQRFIVVGHQARRLVGAAVVKEDDPDPVVTLGPGGAVTGRVVGRDGKPIAGMIVTLRFDHPSVAGVFELLNMRKQVVTDTDGKFRIDTVLPGRHFRLGFSKGPKNYGPRPDLAPQHKVEKHGDTLKLGDVKAEPRGDPVEN
jgi:RNA polymerase sigma factor (sigma-70 family)